MTHEQYENLINALYEFAIRVSKGGSTPGEIAVLPGIVEQLLSNR